MKMRNFLFAGLLAASPLTYAVGQGTTSPDVKAGSTTEADAMKNGAAGNAHQPGATGSTVVPGDKSTVAGTRKGTAETKTGGVAGGSK